MNSLLVQDLETLDATERIYEVYNTASPAPLNPSLSTSLDDGGNIIASGDMGYLGIN